MFDLFQMNKEEAMQAVPHLVPQHNPNDVRFWPFDQKFDKELQAKVKAEANATYYDGHH